MQCEVAGARLCTAHAAPLRLLAAGALTPLAVPSTSTHTFQEVHAARLSSMPIFQDIPENLCGAWGLVLHVFVCVSASGSCTVCS